MRFTFTIDSANAGMTDDEYGGPAEATADLLAGTAQLLREGYVSGELRDVNGNRVGSWWLDQS